MITVGTQIVSKFQPCTPSISKVIEKRVLGSLLSRPQSNKQKQGNFHNRGGSLLKLTSEVTTISAHIVSKFQPCTLVLAKLLQKLYLVASFQDSSHFKTTVHQFVSKLAIWCILLGAVSPSVHVWAIFDIPFKTLVPIQHQINHLAPFKTLGFSLFAAQWLQDSSYSNHQCLTGIPKTSNVHLMSGRVKSS